MLVELAIGDAYAIPWEFVSDTQDLDALGQADLRSYKRHPKYPDLGSGRYTDDTQRTIANAEVMLAGRNFRSLDPVDFGAAYFDAFKRDPRPGYSRSYYRLLQQAPDSKTFLRQLRPLGCTNGALMGAAVLGFLDEPFKVRYAAYAQAMVTHAPETFPWAETVAQMAHYFIHQIGPKDDLADYLAEMIPLPTEPMWETWSTWAKAEYRPCVDMTARTTATSVLNLIANNVSLSAILRDVISRRGDTDTAAALALAIGSCSPEIENDLPEELFAGLENGPYGKDFLEELEDKLRRQFLGQLIEHV